MNKDENTEVIEKKEVVEYLDSLGMKHSIKGFNYIIEAIHGRLCGKYKDGMINMYKDIAKLFDTTGSRVERAIRHAITATNTNLNNGEFIARAVDKFKYQ